MSKKKEVIKPNIESLRVIIESSKVDKVNVESEMKKSFISYAMAVNVSRAIPDVRDGLKPVHRRILFTMNEMGYTCDKPFKKCASTVGDVLGKYHPHGDSSVYDALVRMAQDFSIRCPLIEGHGNFGSVDGDPPAAYRYTEARLSKIAGEMLRDIDKKTVDFYPNYDDTREQPRVLPARYPNLLVNGSEGIAVGMATSIPPHNLGEVIDGALALLENPELEIDDLIEYIPAPDYPTGAQILGRSGIKKAYRTGRGNAIIRSKCDIEELPSGKSQIIVSEIPYQVNKAKLIENIADLVRQKRIEGISDVQEESDREGMRLVITVKKDFNAQIVLNQLYKHTNLQISHSMIMLALIDGTPKILNLKEILSAYNTHQIDVVNRRTRYDLAKALEKEHLLLGLVIALRNIDEVIALIKRSDDKRDAMNKLIERFDFSEKQANAILEMRLQKLTHLEVDKIEEELKVLEDAIADYRDILAKPERVVEIIKAEMLEIKDKYNEPRKSEITYDYNELDIEDLIEQEDVVISMTHGGYIKRQAMDEYKAQRRGGVGVSAHKTKEDDFVEKVYMTNTHEPILFFTNTGRVYRIKAYMIPESSKQAKGRAIVNLLSLADGEYVSAFMPLSADATGYLTLVTKSGLIKKTELTEFERINNNGKICIKLVENDELISAIHTSGDDELLISASNGKCIRFNEGDVRDMGRTARGVKAMRLKDGESIVDAAKIRENSDVITITENGFGKRTDITEYRFQGRAGSGILCGRLNERTGNVVNIKLVSEDEDVMIIADNGTIIRIHADSISKIGRNTQGVKLMRMKDPDSKVVSFTVVPRDEEAEEDDSVISIEEQQAESAQVESEAPSVTDADADSEQNEN